MSKLHITRARTRPELELLELDNGRALLRVRSFSSQAGTGAIFLVRDELMALRDHIEGILSRVGDDDLPLHEHIWNGV